MIRFDRRIPIVLPALVAWLGVAGFSAMGETPMDDSPSLAMPGTSLKLTPLIGLTDRERTHPIVPALRMAQEGIDRMRRDVRDYTCRLVARERIKGILQSHEYMQVKIRHASAGGKKSAPHPFSVYLQYLGPKGIEGREVLFVGARDNSEMVVRNGGSGSLQDVTLSMRPNAPRAMSNHRYPVTDVGMMTLLTRLLDVGREAIDLDVGRECQVQFIKGATIDDRPCTCVQIQFPVRRDKLSFHLARIFVDDESQLPVRYASYSWPQRPGSVRPLQEEYTFLDVKVNVGLADSDFDRNNPSYRFYRPKEQ